MRKNFFSFFNNEEGYVLVTAFIVILVIMVLGFAYANISLSQAQQAERHNDKKQAYYYARSGSEKAFNRIAKALKNQDIDYLNNFSWNLNNEEIDSPNNNSKANVAIEITPNYVDTDEEIEDIEEIYVNSTGKEGNIRVSQSANFILDAPKGYSPPSVGEYSDNPEKVQNLNWVSGGSGTINGTEGEIIGDPNESVIFRGPGNSLHLQNNKTGLFQAKRFYFDYDPEKIEHPIQIPSKSKLVLYSDFLIFYIDIELSRGGGNNSEDGILCLKTAQNNDDAKGFVYFDKEVLKLGQGNENDEVVVSPGAYTFPNEGACLPEDADLLEPYEANKNDIDNWDIKWE